jgi:hypothetical protein
MRNEIRIASATLLFLALAFLSFAVNGYLDFASPGLPDGGSGTETFEIPLGRFFNRSVSARTQYDSCGLTYIAFRSGQQMKELGSRVHPRTGINQLG